MKSRRAPACARCGRSGKHRWIDDLFRWRMYRISVALCDKCYDVLMQADARTWKWFREYRDQ
jgi:hypothetical protein